MLPEDVRKFLLDGPDPSVREGALRDLLDRPSDDPERQAARESIGKDGWAARVLSDQDDAGFWGRFHGDAGELYGPKYIATNWRLLILSDLGMTREDARIDRAAQLVFRYWSGPDGVFGEPGSEVCITGNVVRILTRFGYGDDPRVQAAIAWLGRAQKPDGGWHCFPSEVGTIDGWEPMAAFAVIPAPKRSAEVRRAVERGAEFYLERGLLRETDGSTYLPWARVHYPNHYYYDLLVGLDVLSSLGYADDPRMRPALDMLEGKRRPDGTWCLEAVQPDLLPEDPYHPTPPVYPVLLEYAGVPSRWATLGALRVLRRAGRA